MLRFTGRLEMTLLQNLVIATDIPLMLPAKSRLSDGRVVSLKAHALDTERAAERIFKLDGRWGQNWCRFFKIYSSELQANFLLNLRVSALFHDVGKANEDFYKALTNSNRSIQTLRHEHLSALLLQLPEVRYWLSQNKRIDMDVVSAAVLSHHLKAADTGDFRWCQPRSSTTLKLYLQHDEVLFILKRIGEICKLSGADPALPSNPWSASAPWQQAWQSGIKSARQFAHDIKSNKDRCALLLATKAGLIVADAASSGLVREGHSIDQWIDEKVHGSPISAKDIDNAILSPRSREIERRTGRPFKFHCFQTQTARQGSRVLLLAACASGKTLAAWKWAEAQAEQRKIGNVIFLYPTRGTATEGFRDYVGWAPEADAMLVHGTSRYELESLLSNPSEATKGKTYQGAEDEERLFALKLWSRRYFSATVDQFLGFMEHGYSAMCLLPVLADSVVIIDEVHSFDRRMFNCLLSFLQTFDVPVLCMTATLSPSRSNQLENSGLHLYPTSTDSLQLADLEEKAKHPRYQVESVTDVKDALAQAKDAYLSGLRVLWVLNTVARCQRAAQALQGQINEEVLVYHSRFRLNDRQRIHAATVKAFQQIGMASIAVTTQVCEMSLDLDADVLLTEVAPVSSLVQRFGRANRHLARGKDFRARLLTYQPENALPYPREEIQAATSFLRELGTGESSQRQMVELLEKHSVEEPKADGSSRILDGGYFATRGEFRDCDEYTHPCILDCDVEEVQRAIHQHRPYDAFIVGIPKSSSGISDDRPSWLPRYLAIAKTEFYSTHYGYQGKGI